VDLFFLKSLINQNTIIGGILFFILAELIIGIILRKQKHDWKEAASSIGVALGYVMVEIVGLGVAKFILFSWIWKHHLFNINMNSPVNFLILILVADLCYYWSHRISHNCKWFWLSHLVHHSSNQLTMLTSYRIGWTHFISGQGIFWTPLILIGFPPIYVVMAVTISLVYQFWLHTELIPNLKYIELVINTPAIHKVHHSSRAEDLNSNFAGMFSFYDVIFGTFRRNELNFQYTYGIGDKWKSYNPIKIALYQWFLFFKNFPMMSSFRTKIRYTFGPPKNRNTKIEELK
jgi:sterol desaturase/sphingolipid hydroxylase (fatty acid hydroxylase superfamily)